MPRVPEIMCFVAVAWRWRLAITIDLTGRGPGVIRCNTWNLEYGVYIESGICSVRVCSIMFHFVDNHSRLAVDAMLWIEPRDL
jgi:hypothetical protein